MKMMINGRRKWEIISLGTWFVSAIIFMADDMMTWRHDQHEF